MMILLIKHKTVVEVNKNTWIYAKVIEGLGGICYWIIGIIATKANINAAKFYILPAKLEVWTNIPKLTALNKIKGMKIAETADVGFLYKVIKKCAVSNCFILL